MSFDDLNSTEAGRKLLEEVGEIEFFYYQILGRYDPEVTSEYGERVNPFTGEAGLFHSRRDIASGADPSVDVPDHRPVHGDRRGDRSR